MFRESCPDESFLLRVSLGSRTEEELGALESHLDSCPDCRRVVAAATSDQTLPADEVVRVLGPGDVVERYAIEGLLGVGGMGVVYRARDTTLGRPVAIKLLRAEGDAERDARLEREARTMAQLSHPNLVPAFELGRWRGRVFLAMELVDGLPLDAWGTASQRRDEAVLQVLLDAGRGLAAAHAAGVVHRDFKPANVLVGHDGRARITDFGLARMQATSAAPTAEMLATQVGTLLGTPAYMAPEQLDGEVADARSDQFSFCVAAVEALTGERPFSAPTRAALRESMRQKPRLGRVPRRLRAVLARGLSENRETRWPSMDALLAALSQRRTWQRTAAMAVIGLVVIAVAEIVTRHVMAAPLHLEVVTARVYIPAEARVTAEMFGTRSLPEELFTTSYVLPHQEKWIIGQRTRVQIAPGDIVTWEAFHPVDERQ